jgi:hypothetical protein
MSGKKRKPLTREQIMERFNKRYTPVTESGCWIWDKALADHGYGPFYFNNAHHYAHRIAYELYKGEIPKGMTIDHLCRVRCCVNPDHLEAVTHHENNMRGISTASRHAKQTHCIRGHRFTGENLYRPPSRNERVCRECGRIREKMYKSRASA